MSNKISDEKVELVDHVYDGIVELDNPMPGWLMLLFYGTIFFAGGYFAYYGLGPGASQVQVIEAFLAENELKQLKASLERKPYTADELGLALKSPQALAAGKKVFSEKCVSCHGNAGEGGIGPNLTDDYWIHGGSLVEIANTVAEGVLAKGMPAWGSLLSREETVGVSAYIKSLRGTNPPNAKGPEGVLVKE